MTEPTKKRCRCCNLPTNAEAKKNVYCGRCEPLKRSGMLYHEVCETLASRGGKLAAHFQKQAELRFNEHLLYSANAGREQAIRDQIIALREGMKVTFRADPALIDGQKRKLYRCPGCGHVYTKSQCLPCEWKIMGVVK